jgi:HAMP domain-containing protein
MRLTTRKRLFIDRQVQGALLFRTVVYWFFLLVAASLVMLGVYAITEPGGTFLEYYGLVVQRHGAVAIATLVLLPLVIYDVLVTTNRFAGPLYRMRRAMRALAAGEHVEPLQFREKDYWREMADEFNAIAAYVDEMKREAADDDPRCGGPRDFQPVGSE